MAVKKEKVSSERQSKAKVVGLAANPVTRIRTAEGWRRSLMRKPKLTKAPVKR